jgi:beta-glucosidase
MTIPSDFLWGTATAGHQNEGNDTTSDTSFLEQVVPTVFREPSGIACNGYELWETDLDLVAAMGLNSYRFSVEWARIEPREGHFDQAALDHYEAIVDGCIARGLAPVVTFSHFTSPHWYAAQGAWLNDRGAARFATFCEVVLERLGDRIAYAVTLNEPNLPRLLSWVLPEGFNELTRATLRAAAQAAGVEKYCSSNVVPPEDFEAMEVALTRAHLAAKAVIKKYRPELPVGFSLALVNDIADGADTSIRDRKRAGVYGHWLELARDDDFIGIQNYESVHYDGTGQVPVPDGVPVNEMGTAIDPLSLAGAVRYAWDVARVPIFVTEHGIGTDDDELRVAFLGASLEGLDEVIDDGIPVIGYTHWTLMDNFEWVAGYTSHIGLHSVDRVTMERTQKPSASEYARLVAARR